MLLRVLVCAVVVLQWTAWSRPAVAQRRAGANADLSSFRHAMDSRGFVTVNASQVLGHTEISFGLVTNWGYRLLRFEQGDQSYEVSNIISPTIIAAVGLKPGPLELEFGASLPFAIMNGDRDPDSDGGTPDNPNDDERFSFDGQGIGSAGLHLKTRILNTSRGPRIGLAFIGSLYFPAGEKNKWLGEDSVVPQLMAVIDKEFGKRRQLRVALNGGIRLRPEPVTFVDGPTMDGVPATDQRIEVPSTLPFAAGVALGVVPQRFDVIGEIFGELPLGGEEYFPLEALAGIKVYLAKNSFLSFGGGVGLLPETGGNPAARAFLAIVFEPSIGDRDGDGIKDDLDRCPDDPEDYDDFEDEDGCPDPDNDRDGILDVDDECPNTPEDKDGTEDEDGCPEGDEFDRDGDGIKDDVDKCPDDPEDKDGFEDEDGCPDPDNDKDGILDVDDLCPNDPEDMDKFEDEDGCPDADNDKDRILDTDDACPNDPETYNGHEDKDGCPDRGRVVVTDTKIEILDKIYFEFDSDVIKPVSYPILDALAATMEGNPDIQLVEIQGHTDSRGADAYNLSLSDRRAKAVRRYMIEKGVAESRLEANGYGETRPLDKRQVEDAWAKNRRVEFLIVKRAGE
jgi:outer membrane protein OmpA-like peptidoglycan-associated protein